MTNEVALQAEELGEQVKVKRWFLAYPEYRESRVRWIGELPTNWKLIRVKHMATVVSGGTPDMGNTEFWNGDIPWVSPKDMRHPLITDTQDHITQAGLNQSSTRLVPPLSLLMVVRSGILLHSLPVAINRVPVAINQDIRAILPHRSLLVSYLKFLITGNQRALILEWGKQGATVQSIETPYMLNGLIPVPPLDEQRTIAAFLDRETEKIDRLIAKKERLVELLQEKRTALISHAVTKGLDPDAEMKPTRFPWMREIPAHWALKRLKHISPKQTVGVVVNPSSYFTDSGVPFLLGNNVSEGSIDLTNVRYISEDSNEVLCKSKLSEGDLVVVRVGDPGVTCAISSELAGCNCASVMIVWRSSHFSSKWMEFAFNARVIRSQIDIVKYGAAQKQFNISHAVDFWLPLPPKEEQEQIVTVLNRTLDAVADLRERINAGMAKLHEYRSALISAAVTGKIDVRGHDSKSPASPETAASAD